MTTTQNLVNGKQPIVNGSFNHTLTLEEMLQFDYESKKSMVWNIIVSGDSGFNFRDVAHEIFTPIVKKYTHDMITEENIDELLTTVRTQYDNHHRQLLSLTADFYFKQGKEIALAQRKLGFGGFIKMDYRKLIGYLAEIGSWNDFNWPTVTEGIRTLEKFAPRMNYGLNNPNTGNKKHSWETTGEYVVMKFDYLSEQEVEEVQEFYKNHWVVTGNTIKADSVRIEIEVAGDVRHKKSSATLVFWWD